MVKNILCPMQFVRLRSPGTVSATHLCPGVPHGSCRTLLVWRLSMGWSICFCGKTLRWLARPSWLLLARGQIPQNVKLTIWASSPGGIRFTPAWVMKAKRGHSIYYGLVSRKSVAPSHLVWSEQAKSWNLGHILDRGREEGKETLKNLWIYIILATTTDK